MLRALKVEPVSAAIVSTTVHGNVVSNAKKTATANAAAIATTVTVNANASVPTVRISRAEHNNERPVYGDSILVGRSFSF